MCTPVLHVWTSKAHDACGARRTGIKESKRKREPLFNLATIRNPPAPFIVTCLVLIPIDSLSLPSCPSCPSSFSLTTLCHRVSPPFLLDRGPGTQRSLLATGFPIPRTLYAASNRDYTTCLPDSYYALLFFSFFLSHFFIFSLRIKRKLTIQICDSGLKLRSKFFGFKFFSRNFWFLYL